MTVDAVRAGLTVEEVELDLAHRATGRDARGFLHRGRQLADVVLACGPTAVNHRGLRLPLAGWAVAVVEPTAAPVGLVGLADDLWSGPERGFRAHLRAGTTTGVLKLAAIPLYGLVRPRRVSGAARRSSRRTLSTSSTRNLGGPQGVLLASAVLGFRPRKAVATVLLAPYDLREMAMLGDSGANARAR